MRQFIRGTLIAACSCAAWLAPTSTHAQGTLADYRRAAGIDARLADLTINVADAPTWIASTNQLWYRKTVQGGSEFVLVDAATQQKRPAFDHERLARALASAGGGTATARRLGFNTFTYGAGMQ